MRKLYKSSVSAYMTVEAALVLPMVICCIVLLIYIAFHVFAVCLLTGDMYILGLRGSHLDYGSTYDSGVEYVEDNMDKQVSGKYFGNRSPEITVFESGDHITLEGSSETHHGAMGSFFLMPVRGWDIRISESLKLQKQVKRIREVTRAKDLLHIGGEDAAPPEADAPEESE